MPYPKSSIFHHTRCRSQGQDLLRPDPSRFLYDVFGLFCPWAMFIQQKGRDIRYTLAEAQRV